MTNETTVPVGAKSPVKILLAIFALSALTMTALVFSVIAAFNMLMGNVSSNEEVNAWLTISFLAAALMVVTMLRLRNPQYASLPRSQ